MRGCVKKKCWEAVQKWNFIDHLIKEDWQVFRSEE